MAELIRVSVPIISSARVLQIQSLFDVPPTKESVREWKIDLSPLDQKEWTVGLVVGPSGSGKSSVARKLWPQVDTVHAWDPDKAIVDCFPQGMPISEITGLLTSVGLSTTKAWLRPHRILSTGEQFRANVAMALTRNDSPTVVDEFTSTVNREVGRVASFAVAKAVRRRGQKFVAVTCHEDVEPWLTPDWVLRMDTEELLLREGKKRHPPVELDIGKISSKAWRYFSHLHYLSSKLPGGMIGCYGGWIGDKCVAFMYVCRFPHPVAKDIVRARRQVVLPDYQGLGIASRMEEWAARKYSAMGNRFRSISAHPAMNAHYNRSPDWAYISHHPQRLRVGPKATQARHQLDPRQMTLRTYEWREKK